MEDSDSSDGSKDDMPLPLHLSDESDASSISHDESLFLSESSESDGSSKSDELNLHLSDEPEDCETREVDDQCRKKYETRDHLGSKEHKKHFQKPVPTGPGAVKRRFQAVRRVQNGITEAVVSVKRDHQLDKMAASINDSNRNDATYRARRLAKIISSVDEENDTESVLLEPDKVIPFVKENWSGVSRRNAFNQICSYLQKSDLSYSKVLKCLPVYRSERRKVDIFRSTSRDSGREANVRKKLSDASAAASVSAAENLETLEKNLRFAVEKQSFWIKETAGAWAAATKALFVIIAAENTPKHAVALRCVDVQEMRKENAGFTIETENLKFSFKKATGTLLSRYASLRKQKFTGASQHLLVNLKKKPLKISNYIPSSKPPTESAKPKCSICGKTVSSTSYLQVHLRIHLQDKPFECRVCKAAFADRSNLRKHVLIHDQGRSSEDVDSPE